MRSLGFDLGQLAVLVHGRHTLDPVDGSAVVVGGLVWIEPEFEVCIAHRNQRFAPVQAVRIAVEKSLPVADGGQRSAFAKQAIATVHPCSLGPCGVRKLLLDLFVNISGFVVLPGMASQMLGFSIQHKRPSIALDVPQMLNLVEFAVQLRPQWVVGVFAGGLIFG